MTGFIAIQRVRQELEYWEKALDSYHESQSASPADYIKARTKVKTLQYVLGIESFD